MPIKDKMNIHSASLVFDEVKNQLIGYGGSDENANMPAYLYKLKLEQSQNYEWERIAINNSIHQGYIWQHSSNLSTRSLFTQQDGIFLTVIGGCRFPHAPYDTVVEINL